MREPHTVCQQAPGALLAVSGLTVSYGERTVLNDLDLIVRRGELVALFGPNGSGKSTFFKAVMGSVPSRGDIHLDGHLARTLPVRTRATLVTHVPQEHDAVFPLRVVDVVVMGRTPYLQRHRGPLADDMMMALRALRDVGAEDLADRVYTELSGGQRQLVMLARALAQDCPLILLDEPTASLDYGNQHLTWQLMRMLAERGHGVLVCSHDPRPVREFCHRALVLGRHGALLGDGIPADVLDDAVLHNLYPQLAVAP